jgi:tRNA (guanine-N7-)-methyltransferase
VASDEQEEAVRRSLVTRHSSLVSSFWRGVFGNANPVWVEIGPGRGEFLLDTARKNPQQNYFAIERAGSSARRIEAEIECRRLANARVVGGDATCVIAMLPDACVAGYYLLFPDPWWKRRHERRRVITPTFFSDLRRTLEPGGLVHFATDVRDYFMLGQSYLDADPELEPIGEIPVMSTFTAFARKAQARGDPLFASVHRRRASHD